MAMTEKMPTEQLRTIYKELEEEHAAILALIARAKITPPGKELLELLDELHGILQRHFARESYPGGFYESIGACSAEHADDLRDLVNEHFRILSKLWTTIESMRWRNAEFTKKIADDVVAVSDMLEAHERKEHELAESLIN